ncbi:Uncharacterised protein [Mycobacteroides abscessus subsp. massiliense]|nr:Uncharacterised protein [Mycobacteroides abscessus subsp. massiliense]
MIGDQIRLELLVEVRDTAEFGQALVDGDAGHLLGTRRHNALPAKPAVGGDGRDHLHAPGQERIQRA